MLYGLKIELRRRHVLSNVILLGFLVVCHGNYITQGSF